MNSLALLLTLAVHPLHTSHTTITVESSGRFTVAIRVFTDDLHFATTRHGGAFHDSTVAAYVRSTVLLTASDGRNVPLSWDGTTPDGDVTRIALHGVLPGGAANAMIRQTMQTEMYSDQVNVVQIREGDRRLSLLFTPGDRAKPLS